MDAKYKHLDQIDPITKKVTTPGVEVDAINKTVEQLTKQKKGESAKYQTGEKNAQIDGKLIPQK